MSGVSSSEIKREFVKSKIGLVGIGIDPTGLGSKLFIRTTDSANYGLKIQNGHTTQPRGMHIDFYDADQADLGNEDYFMYIEDEDSPRFVMYPTGNVQNVNNSYGQISDIRLKENIEDCTPKLDDINKLRIVNFNFKEDIIGGGLKQIGVIADEAEEVFPGLIDVEDATEHGGYEDQKSFKYSVLVPMLVKAVQELTTEVETLKQQINS